MVGYFKVLFGLLVLFAMSPSLAQTQYSNRVVVIPLLGDESTWQGPWVVDRVYKTADIVEDGGSSYIALKTHTSSLANIPPDAEFWELVAASGAKGDTGQKGGTGETGPQGPAGPGSFVSVDETTIFETIPDATKPNEKTLSGIVYGAGSNISITTPNTMKPNQQTITFNPAGLGTVSSEPIDIRDPYLAVNYIIALQGIFPSRSASDPLLAEIILFGAAFAPSGWAFCDGQLLEISQNSALFSLLGTFYGGDGRTTFALPDLRGRSAIGPRNGPGLSDFRVGQKGGRETIVVTPVKVQ